MDVIRDRPIAVFLCAGALLSGFSGALLAPNPTHAFAVWPAGLAVAGLTLLPREAASRVLWLLGVSAVLAQLVGGTPSAAALLLGLGAVTSMLAASRLLRPRGRAAVLLLEERDLQHFLVAGVSVAAVGAAAAGLAGLVWPGQDPLALAATYALTGAAQLLILVPVVAVLRAHGSLAAPFEATFQRAALVVLVSTLLVLPEQSWLCLVLVAVLGWGGQRLRGREALAQMYAVMILLAAATYAGIGPFAALAADPEFTADGAGRLLAGFAIACSVMVVSQVLRSGEQIEATSVAADERDSLQRILAATTGVAIIEAGQDGRISLFNVGAERLLGYDAADMLGTPLADLVSTASRTALARSLRVREDWLAISGALARPDRVGTEVELVRADGTLRTHAMTLARVTDERGESRGFLSTSEDVTDQIASREALEDLVQRLHDVDEIKDSFVATVSHELRTPLTSILGYVELLEDAAYGELSESQRRALVRISDNSDRLLLLIDDLLSLSRVRVDSVYGKGANRVVDLRDVVARAHAALAPGACRPGLSIAVNLGQEPALVLGSPARLEQAVSNLLTNGLKFTPGPGDGQVSVSLRREGLEHVISVQDSGMGIPASEHEHLFTRFFRGAESHGRAIQGSGLGLSIVREIVEGHLGRINVESAPGRGARFEVWLPALPADGGHELVGHSAAGAAPSVG